MEPTKTPTRDYPAMASNEWKLWDTLYGRRSHRKYLPLRLDGGTSAKIEEMAELALEVRGALPGSIIARTDSDQAQKIKRASYRGMEGAINLWLLRTPVSGFLVLAVPRDDVSAARPEVLPLTSMAAQDVILWLTEAGLGTCWMAGVNSREVRKVMGLDAGMIVPAIIAIGKPKKKIEARDLDTFFYRRLTRHRKPISSIASREIYGKPFSAGVAPSGTFPVSEIQDIEGLLRKGRTARSQLSEIPLELAIEACLEAARVAPSAGNQQKWHFIAVSSEERLSEIASACGGSQDWRAAIVGAGYPGKLYAMVEKPFWMIDLPIAFSNMSLMAASMNVVYDVCADGCDEHALNEATRLPAELRTFGVLGLK